MEENEACMYGFDAQSPWGGGTHTAALANIGNWDMQSVGQQSVTEQRGGVR